MKLKIEELELHIMGGGEGYVSSRSNPRQPL